ncbi:MAG: hypothetical protein KF723_21275 [Rhizobiaceae bacterium]|nr:hypothetical protein [Rhizobiaceae bacterium]
MADRDERAGESGRILGRIERETAAGDVTPGKSRSTPGDDDWIEAVGTRIGRTLGLIIAAGLTTWIVLYALSLI